MDVSSPQREERKRIEVFCCYTHKDQALFLELKAHLMPLQREGLITLWADTDIRAGEEWEKEIHSHLNTAQIILLLISPDFLASEYCFSIEMQRAMRRHEQGEACVIPIILRPVSWQKQLFAKLQALPTDAVPITSGKWRNQDEAFLAVTEGIRGVVAEQVRLVEAKQAHLSEVTRQETKPLSSTKISSRTRSHSRFKGVLAIVLLIIALFLIGTVTYPFLLLQLRSQKTDPQSIPTQTTMTWTIQHSGTSQRLSSIIWSGKELIAVGGEGTILTSSDGIKWTIRHSGVSNDLYAVCKTGFDLQQIIVGGTGPNNAYLTPTAMCR